MARTSTTAPINNRHPLSLDGLHAILDGYYAFQFLHAAVKLDLFTILATNRNMTAEAITRELGLAERAARILLLGCTALGLIRKNGARYFCSDVAAMTLVEGSPWDQRSLVTFGHEVCYRPMWWFYESLRKNTNIGLCEYKGEGSTLYARLAEHPDADHSFHGMMGMVSQLVAKNLVSAVDLSTGGRLLDVGGGAGVNARALAERWPDLELVILDLPSVSAVTADKIAADGLQARIRTIAGDCFAEEFPTTDHVLFAHFLEIWSPEQIRILLDRAFRAMQPGGMLFLVNLIQDDDGSGPASAATSSAYFLSLASGVGMVYTWNEYEDWLRAAGFSPEQRSPLTPAHGLIVARRS